MMTIMVRACVAGGDGESKRGSRGVDVDEVVAYAHKVSYTTSAPPNWNPSLPHMRMFLPPAPQDINILQGNIYHNSTSVPIPGIYHHLHHLHLAIALMHVAHAHAHAHAHMQTIRTSRARVRRRRTRTRSSPRACRSPCR
jgi:hypothetical protein